MTDNYYVQGVDAHVCPFCHSWVLEVPRATDPHVWKPFFTEHLTECLGGVDIPVTIT